MQLTDQSRRDSLLALIREGKEMTFGQQLKLTAILALPAILAQLSAIIMQYIDAAMVGSLGEEPSAAIGLMATSTWLFWGICSAVGTGFSVQVAHKIGAKDKEGARSVLRQSMVVCLCFSLILTAIGILISGRLPLWLGGSEAIAADASTYFLIFICSLPALQICFLSGAMLRCSGNTFFPGMLNVAMCMLDVVFNFFLIYPTRDVTISNITVTMPGAGLGIAGAALGTALAELTACVLMTWYLWQRNPELNLRGKKGSFRPRKPVLRKALVIGAPLAAEHTLMCGAQVIITAIVAPLGLTAIAANAFAVTAESLCYMPGYGIAEAATTLIGQSLGAARKSLARRFANITVGSGIVVMTVMGLVMYVCAPMMMGIISPVESICDMGVEILRIEAFAEPMFAAAIVACGVFIGAGDTLVPSCMNLGSIWGVRLTLAYFLAPTMGLRGVWIAMAIELTFRGAIFLWRLFTPAWQRKVNI